MMNRSKTAICAVIAAAGLGFAGAASAMPVGPGLVQGDAPIIQVWGGCGPDMHPTRFGECRPSWRARYFAGPGVYGPPRHHHHHHHHQRRD